MFLCIQYDSTDYSKLRERQVIYATSIPGETEWHESRATASTSTSSSDPDTLASELSSRLQVSQNASTSSTSRNNYANKFPLPGVAHTGALVKLYPASSSSSTSSDLSTDNVKATEIVDFVGIVDYSTFPTLSSLEEPVNSDTSTSYLPEQVKTLHAIYRMPTISSTQVETPAQQNTSARQEVIDQLAEALQGDKLAAEWLLLALLGKIHTRRGALALGQLPINLILPLTMDDTATVVNKLQKLLQQLLPRLVKLDFHVAELNKVKYLPESKDENLISGVLQLPRGTTLLVDETRMGEGNLQDRGRRRYREALQSPLKQS